MLAQPCPHREALQLLSGLLNHRIDDRLADAKAMLSQVLHIRPQACDETKLFGLEQNPKRTDFVQPELSQLPPSLPLVHEHPVCIEFACQDNGFCFALIELVQEDVDGQPIVDLDDLDPGCL